MGRRSGSELSHRLRRGALLDRHHPARARPRPRPVSDRRRGHERPALARPRARGLPGQLVPGRADLAFRDRYFQASTARARPERSFTCSTRRCGRGPLRPGQPARPRLARDRPAYDVIFCRNVLIYLDWRRAATAFATLDACSPPGSCSRRATPSGSRSTTHVRALGGNASFALRRAVRHPRPGTSPSPGAPSARRPPRPRGAGRPCDGLASRRPGPSTPGRGTGPAPVPQNASPPSKCPPRPSLLGIRAAAPRRVPRRGRRDWPTGPGRRGRLVCEAISAGPARRGHVFLLGLVRQARGPGSPRPRPASARRSTSNPATTSALRPGADRPATGRPRGGRPAIAPCRARAQEGPA